MEFTGELPESGGIAGTLDREDLTPFCDESTFAQLVRDMVTDTAPRVFAVVQVWGERADARIAAWGMAWEDSAEVIGVEGHPRMSLSTPERACRLLSHGDNVTAHLMWLTETHPDPDLGTTPTPCR